MGKNLVLFFVFRYIIWRYNSSFMMMELEEMEAGQSY